MKDPCPPAHSLPLQSFSGDVLSQPPAGGHSCSESLPYCPFCAVAAYMTQDFQAGRRETSPGRDRAGGTSGTLTVSLKLLELLFGFKAPGPSWGLSSTLLPLGHLSLTPSLPTPKPHQSGISPGSSVFISPVRWFPRRPLTTPGRELADGQGARFLHHPGQPELPRGLLHIRQVLTTLTPPDLLKRLKRQGDLLNMTYPSGAWWQGAPGTMYQYIHLPPLPALMLLEEQDFYQPHFLCVLQHHGCWVSVCGRGMGREKEQRISQRSTSVLELQSFFF